MSERLGGAFPEEGSERRDSRPERRDYGRDRQREYGGDRRRGYDRDRRDGGSGRPEGSPRSGGRFEPGPRRLPAGTGNRTDRAGRPARPGGAPRSDRRPRAGAGPDRAGGRGSERQGGAPPRIPESITEDQLSRESKAELRGLPLDLAAIVGRYLVAAELESDPEQAYRYAQAARRLAARIGIVREVNGITAYQTGRWAEALAELRAARRLTGRGEYLPLMADSERALGRLDRALELVHSEDAKRLPRAAQIEMRIVESGIRRDQGLADAAVLALQVPELTDGRLRPWSARLFYAYGDALLAAGRPEAAREAFSRAVVADENEDTDALARLDELDGITVEDLEDLDDEDLEDEDEDEDEDDWEDVDDETDSEDDEDLEDLEDDEDFDDEDDEDEDEGEDEDDWEDVDDEADSENVDDDADEDDEADSEDVEDQDEDDVDEAGPAPATAAEHVTPEPSADAAERD